jgi:hypothetical protein
MKKFLLSAIILLAGMFIHTAYSQCTITNLGVNLKSFNASTCRVQFDLSWEQEVNGGNKYAYVHLWTGALYHTPAANWATMYSNPAAYPKAADLANSLGTISIFENGSAVPKIGISYPPDDAGVIPLSAGLSVIKTPLPGSGRERMTILNIELVLASCENVISVKADVWASQASNGKNVHCVSGGLSFNLNNPRVTGFKICAPRSVTFGIANNDPLETITVYYNLYKDDGDEVFEPGTGSGLDGLPILVSSDIVIAPLQSWAVVKMSYPGSDANGETGSLWMEVITKVPAFSFAAIGKLADPGCIPLSVQFGNFTAKRDGSTVWLKWETLSESNNLGFAAERNATGIWEQIGFTATKAFDGNSNNTIGYQYADNNAVKGITQYRIRQVGKDGKNSYSEIRAVYGEGVSNTMTIYPNPAYNGKITIVFGDADAVRDISLTDLNGRLVKRLPQVSSNTVVIENLRPGIYLVRTISNGTGEQIVKKVMIY